MGFLFGFMLGFLQDQHARQNRRQRAMQAKRQAILKQKEAERNRVQQTPERLRERNQL